MMKQIIYKKFVNSWNKNTKFIKIKIIAKAKY